MNRLLHPLPTLLPALLALAGVAAATPIVVPPGLAPGSTYRIVFVTSTTRDATAAGIGIYNNFVTTVASAVPQLAGLGTTWTVLGSTSQVNALDNAGLDPADTATPFYNTAGQLVATGVRSGPHSLYNTSGILWNTISNEFGDSQGGLVFTGTNANGGTNTLPGYLGAQQAIAGYSQRKDSGLWTAFYYLPSTEAHSYYGISAPLTVPAPTPEPGTLATFGVGALLIAVYRLRLCRT